MKATEFDRKFDDGEDMSEHLDWSKATRPNAQTKQVNHEASDELDEAPQVQYASFQNPSQALKFSRRLETGSTQDAGTRRPSPNHRS